MEHLVILDYAKGEVHKYNIDSNTLPEGEVKLEDYFRKLGNFNIDEISWMVAESVKFEFHD